MSRSVTVAKRNKIVKRNIEVRKSQAVAKVKKQAKLKTEIQLKQLEQKAFELSNPVERLKKSPDLKTTRAIERVRATLSKDLEVSKELRNEVPLDN